MISPIDSSVKLSKPFSSDTDEEKHVLEQDAELYRDKLELQWSDLKSDASQYGKQALIIGGIIGTTYLVMHALLPGSKKKDKGLNAHSELVVKKVKQRKKNQFVAGKAVQSLAWTLAIGWARQKLKNYVADDRRKE